MVFPVTKAVSWDTPSEAKAKSHAKMEQSTEVDILSLKDKVLSWNLFTPLNCAHKALQKWSLKEPCDRCLWGRPAIKQNTEQQRLSRSNTSPNVTSMSVLTVSYQQPLACVSSGSFWPTFAHHAYGKRELRVRDTRGHARDRRLCRI